MFFTTASEATVAPKLKFGHEELLTLSGYVRASYADLPYLLENCKTLRSSHDIRAFKRCLKLQIQLESYLDSLTYDQT
jgi:hypothetical protein